MCIMFQPLNKTSLTDHFLRPVSLVKMNPPLRVPTSTITFEWLLIYISSFPGLK
jgi:hypothetical protein